MPRTLIHDVSFTLHDPSPANIDRLVAACYELLAGHPGERFFAAGTVAHYQVSPRHQRFVAEHKSTWLQVRVCHSYAAC